MAISKISSDGLAAAGIAQSNMGTGVAGTGPAFSAYANNAQTINTNTDTKIQLNSEEFDTNNNFDSSTNYRFTPTVAGYYQISWCVALQNNYSESFLFKNGSRYKIGSTGTSDGAYAFSSGSALVYCNGSTDYLELYVFQSSGSSKSTLNGLIYTYMSGSLARAA